jgi:hypothetical protein
MKHIARRSHDRQISASPVARSCITSHESAGEVVALVPMRRIAEGEYIYAD